MNFIDEHDRAGIGLDFLDDRLYALLEIAAVASAREKRSHVEREDRRILENFRHLALHDPARKSFGDRRLSDARVAHEERVVLRTAAQDLNRSLAFAFTSDQRIDLALLCLLVEIDAVIVELLGCSFLSAALPRLRLR